MSETHGRTHTIKTAGWEPEVGIPTEDYEDFRDLSQSMDEVRKCLQWGHFPPGLILFDGKTKAQVIGGYGDKQILRRLKC